MNVIYQNKYECLDSYLLNYKILNNNIKKCFYIYQQCFCWGGS